MKGKSTLMAGVAAVALVVSAQAGLAGKSNSDNTSAASTASQEQLDQLSQRVDALESELQASEVREAAGKDPEGTLKLRASHEGGHVIIEISDDPGDAFCEKTPKNASPNLAPSTQPTDSEPLTVR